MLRLLFRFFDYARHRRRQRLLGAREAAGLRGEDLAHRYLERRGFTVVARNFRTRAGTAEIDIVAWDGDKLVFVEVKTRTSEEYGRPERAMSEGKRRRLFRGAQEYVRRADVDWQRIRFDLVTVVLDRPPRIEHQRDIYPLRAAAR